MQNNQDHKIFKNENFQYLRSIIHKKGYIEDNVVYKIKVGWMK